MNQTERLKEKNVRKFRPDRLLKLVFGICGLAFVYWAGYGVGLLLPLENREPLLDAMLGIMVLVGIFIASLIIWRVSHGIYYWLFPKSEDEK